MNHFIILINFQFSDDHIIFESEYHRERKIRLPVGIPSHCSVLLQMPSLQLQQNRSLFTSNPDSIANKTTIAPENQQRSQCESFCMVEAGKNQPSDLPEVPEMIIPDIIESSTAMKPQINFTSKSDITEPSNEQINQTRIDNQKIIHIEMSTVLYTPSKSFSPNTTSSTAKINKVHKSGAIQVEQPIEVRETFTTLPQITQPSTSSLSDQNNDAISNKQNLNNIQQLQQNKSKDQTIGDSDLITDKKSSVESITLPSSPAAKFIGNDIKKKTQSVTKLDKMLPSDLEVSKTEGFASVILVNSSQKLIDTQTTSTNHAPNIVESTSSSCIIVDLMIRSESFNITLGSDEICHNFNITYDIPLSKYMKENRLELVFM